MSLCQPSSLSSFALTNMLNLKDEESTSTCAWASHLILISSFALANAKLQG